MKENDGQKYFYFANGGQENGGSYHMDFHKMNARDDSVTLLHSETSDESMIPPHTIKKIGDFLFCSHF